MHRSCLFVLPVVAITAILAQAAAFFIEPAASKLIIAISGLTGLAALSGLLFYLVMAGKSVSHITKTLNSGKSIDRKDFKAGALGGLVKAVSAYVEQLQQRADQAEHDLSDMQVSVGLLERQKKNIEEIIYSIRDAVIVCDDRDRIVMANSAAEEVLDFDANESGMRALDKIVAWPELVKLVQTSRRSKQRHVKHELSLELHGEPKTYDCIISCVIDDNQEVAGIVAVMHDITKEKEISQMKNDFVSHVSHELKTPLASINAYAEMLVDGEADDQETITQFCTIIQSQADRLNRLIEEILNISRIESGLIKVDKEDVSLTMLVQEAAKMIKSYAGEKSIGIDMPAPIIYDQVNADKDMMSQVIINYLSNAVKYTPAGGEVSVQSQVDEADGFVRVTVTDNGVGIPPEDVDHVFDKFYRVESNKKYAKGTGLGLNLVKQIVEKVHGGRVFVTSEVGKGSTFGFEVPLAAKAALSPK
ncbi:Alkaline phosphatase synthesis sensor protein PhoR [Anaerohalosphaera lusitana]|uniref:histidine kinase n=1 Tax=Anaerohalosphaera lusitana TaxID=1936003 RepID=A0A1U9NM71_9BACT|nr:ATP-binding protein [Anaerohalosphaera lusitana]AQT68907.1 Alkaline phosphatase synthesis sensor protein PhoR [Anaerohalosphaera lusitana]